MIDSIAHVARPRRLQGTTQVELFPPSGILRPSLAWFVARGSILNLTPSRACVEKDRRGPEGGRMFFRLAH